MKVKQDPEDFVVEEVLRPPPGRSGPVVLYRLEKTGADTLEVVRALVRGWHVSRRDVSFAGLKDRHAHTVQTIAIRGGPQRSHHAARFHVTPVGRSPRPIAPGDLEGNRFRIRLRDLSAQEAARLAERARDVGRHGFANYYDDQRFGSARGTAGRFVAEALVRGDAQEVLRLAIASPSPADRGRDKAVRRRLRERWGHWGELARTLPPGPERRACGALADGCSFEEAYGRLDRDLRSLHLSAFQAALFNDCLRRAVGSGPAHPGLAGAYVFFPGSPGDLANERVPLAGGRAEPHPLLDAVLAERGLERTMLAHHPFRRGLRGLVAHPEELAVGRSEADALNPGRQALVLSFRLGPGSYATMLLKRITYDVVPRQPRGKGRTKARRPPRRP